MTVRSAAPILNPARLRLSGVLTPPSVCRRIAPLLTRWVAKAIDDGQQIDPTVRAWVEAVRAEAHAATSAVGSPEVPVPFEASPLPHEHETGIGSREAAARIGCTARNVTDLASRGSLPGRKTGRAWRFEPADVDDYPRRHAHG